VLPDGGSPQAQQAALAVLEEERRVGAPGATLQALRQRLRAFAQGARLEGALGRGAAAAAAAAAAEVSETAGAAHDEAARGVVLTLRLVQALCAGQHLGLQRLMLSGHAPAAAATPPASTPAAPAAAAEEAAESTAETEGAGLLFVAGGDADRDVRGGAALGEAAALGEGKVLGEGSSLGDGGALGACGVLGEAARHLVAFAAWPQPRLLPLARQASRLPLQNPYRPAPSKDPPTAPSPP